MARRRGTGLVPGVVPLEGRVVPSTITVTNPSNAGPGSLRAAIELANADAAEDTIDFASSVTGTITLRSALPDLSSDITLSGPGTTALTVARNDAEGTPEFRIFIVDAGARVTISGLTITGGRLSGFGSGGSVSGINFNEGGGVANLGTLTVTHSTISGNTAALGGGIGNSGPLAVTMSIFANSTGGNLFQNTFSSFVSRGHNLFTDDPAVTLDPTDRTNTDPMLAPLGDYGGPTPTMALLPSSPAIDAGVAVAGVTTDQRGLPRPQGSAPDIGAFKSRGFLLALASGNHQVAQLGSTFAVPLIV